MKSLYYITFIIGLGCSGLAGCTGVPIAKTNCWATAGSTVTTSTMGASPDAGLVSRGSTSSLDVIPCR
jgi:branched-subunit amino acid ABC-type transport system permease component